MKAALRVVWVAMFLLATAVAQNYVAVSGSNLTDATGSTKLASGEICFQPMLAGVPTSYALPGGGQASRQPSCFPVSGGAFMAMLPNVALTAPINVGFKVTVTDSSTGKTVLGQGAPFYSQYTSGYDAVQPYANSAPQNGSTWCVSGVCNFDNYPPNLAPMVAIQTGPPGTPAPGFNPRGGWSSSLSYGVSTYNVADAVTYLGSIYVALAASTNVIPGTDPTKWLLYVAAGTGGGGGGGTGGGGGGATWGLITGTLGSQTDLQAALNAKANTSALAGVAFSGSFNDLLSKPTLGTAAPHAATDFVAASQVGAASGVASLDSSTKLPHAQLPALVSGDIPNNAASTSGQAAAAAALAAPPSICPAGQAPTGIAANGNAVGCQFISATSLGSLPTPPASAVVFNHLEDGTFTICNPNNNCAVGSANGIGETTVTYGVSTPSLSGTAMEFSNATGSGTVNTAGAHVTWEPGGAGVQFNAGWAGQPIKINGATYTIAPVSLTVNTSGTAVTCSSCFYSLLNGQSVTINGVTATVTYNSSSSLTSSVSLGTHTGVTMVTGEPVPTATTLYLTASAGTQTGVAYIDTVNWNALLYQYMSPHGGPWTGGDGSSLALTSISNLLYDVSIYPVPASNLTGYEFDPDIYTSAGYGYVMSVACYTTGAGDWRIYNSSGGWVATGIPCTLDTTDAGAWDRLQWWNTIDQSAHTYTYQSMVYTDSSGTQHVLWSPSNPLVGMGTYTARAASYSELNVQMQIDNASGLAGTNKSYIDNFSLTAWSGTSSVGSSGAVTSFDGRTGPITLLLADITAALGYTPAAVISGSATCNATTAGQFNYIQGSSTTKDIVQVCAHDASNVYAWRPIY